MIVIGIVSVVLLAVAAVVPVAARMGAHSNHPASTQATSAPAATTSASQSALTAISLTQARSDFTQYLNQLGYSHLKVGQVMQFSNQFYADAVDSQTGAGAFEMVMNLNGGDVYPEPGPTMMWNTTYSPMYGSQGANLRQHMPGYGANGNTGYGYGMMGASGYGYGMMGGCDDGDDNGSAAGHGYGMMGGYGHQGDTAATPGSSTGYGWCDGDQAEGYYPGSGTPLNQPLTAETARARVQSWLDQNHPGVNATDATAFPGYFTFHTMQNGKITGMLSIQSSTGAIWQHVWCGDFVAMDPAS